MNLWKSIFTAELRRGRYFLAAIVILHSMVVLMGRFISLQGAPGVLSFAIPLLGWASLAVGLAYMIASLWTDNPTRGETHLSTRPVRFSRLVLPKALAFLLMTAVPATIAEALALNLAGWPDLRTIALGALQQFVVAATLVIAVFPLVWLWRKWSHALGGVLLAAAAGFSLAYAAISLHWVGNNGNALTDTFRSPRFVLLWLLLAALGSALLFLLQRRLRVPAVVKAVAFAAVVIGAMIVSWKVQLIPDKAEDLGRAPLVKFSFKRFDNKDGTDYGWLQMEPPPPPLGDQEEVMWNFRRLSLNGKEVNVLPGRNLSSYDRSHYTSLAILNTLPGRETGIQSAKPGVSLPLQYQRGSDAEMRVDDLSADGSFTVEAELEGTVVTWVKVLDQHISDAISEVSLREPSYPLWLGEGLENRILGSARYRCFIQRLDSKTVSHIPVITPGEPHREGARAMGGGSVVIQRKFSGATTLTLSRSGGFRGQEDRFIVMKPTVTRKVVTRWKSPSPIAPTSFRPSPVIPEVIGGEGETRAIRWLSQNPMPGEDASHEVASAWLAKFLPLANHSFYEPMAPKGEHARLREILRTMAREHIDAYLDQVRALGNHYGAVDGFVRHAWDYVTPEIIRRRPAEEIELYWPYLIENRKWRDQLTDYAIRETRQGRGWQARRFLQAGETAKQLTKEELLALLRLHPSATSYEIALKGGLSREELAPVVEEIMKPAYPLSRGPVLSLVGMSLAAGRMDGLGWYMDLMERWVGWIPHEEWSEGMRYLDLPSHFSGQHRMEVLGWWKDKTPDDFIFVPEIRKFRMK